MNPTNRAASAYRQAATRVPPITAVALLYDKAIVLLKQAVQTAQAGQFEESYGCVSKATAILRGLSHVLDFNRGGAIAEALLTTYTRNILALHGSFGKPDMTERYVKIVAGLSDLRDSWAAIARPE
jgi:flagellar protein FliS